MRNRNRFAAVLLALVMAASQGTWATAAEAPAPAQESVAAQAVSGNESAADGSGEAAEKAGTGTPAPSTGETSASEQGGADAESGQSAADASSPSENGQTESGQTASGLAESGQEASGQTAGSQAGSGQTASGQTEPGQAAGSQTESAQQIEAEQAAAGQTETAQLNEKKLAEEPSKVQGEVRLTASIEGAGTYAGRAEKDIVWLQREAENGRQLTLKAEVANLSKDASVNFNWSSNIRSDIQQVTGARPAENTGVVSDTRNVSLEDGVYGYFCTVTVQDPAKENLKMDYRLAYIVRDPLEIDTKDTSIHVSPKVATVADSGTAQMEIKGSLKLYGDELGTDWNPDDEYDSWDTKKISSNADSVLTTATLKGIDDPSCTVTCRLWSKYSPDAVYGVRTVTFTIDTVNHTYGDWKVTKEATVWAAGEREHVCTVCGYKETESVPKLTPTITANMTSVPVQAGKATDKFCVALANGDYIQKWESSDRRIFSVSGKFNGTCTIRARRKGRATITATAASGLQITALVKVQKGIVKTRAITGLPSTVTIKKGQRSRLTPVLSPLTSQNPVTYKSSSTKIAAVSRTGRIRGVAPGRCKVTVTSGKVSVKVTVTVTGVDATAIRHVRTAYTLKKGRTRQLYPKLTPANATSRIRYKSSNKKVVTVSPTGKLTAKRKGTATITIRAINLESASIVRQVTVTVR
ncbi:MAG: Ig-like domain-containing protein [Porcincola intestinalis]|uniref:Ig-like domain-containing protein n=1 Tax=Porcincola intestinalis TaxID=2606632 RepID=UPI002A90E74F|nr:Ig-like domain-containing protein [Porcincola intestinalis]MDY5332669.1 Ig-like domain-containing protein [Porcincola intestinalis]